MMDLFFVIVLEFLFDRKPMRFIQASNNIEQIALETGQIVHIVTMSITNLNQSKATDQMPVLGSNSRNKEGQKASSKPGFGTGNRDSSKSVYQQKRVQYTGSPNSRRPPPQSLAAVSSSNCSFSATLFRTILVFDCLISGSVTRALI